MSESAKKSATDAVALARFFLDAMEARDLDVARRVLSPDFIAIYPGNRSFRTLEDLIASGAKRYRGVRKSYMRSYHVPADADGVETVIFSGTLRGSWAEGGAFEGIRFTDRFRIRSGFILEQEVWNDIAEALLARS